MLTHYYDRLQVFHTLYFSLKYSFYLNAFWDDVQPANTLIPGDKTCRRWCSAVLNSYVPDHRSSFLLNDLSWAAVVSISCSFHSVLFNSLIDRKRTQAKLMSLKISLKISVLPPLRNCGASTGTWLRYGLMVESLNVLKIESQRFSLSTNRMQSAWVLALKTARMMLIGSVLRVACLSILCGRQDALHQGQAQGVSPPQRQQTFALNVVTALCRLLMFGKW